MRRLLENQQDADADDYIHSLKVDMFDDEVFVFTPKGKVMCLPAGSTPIDFAYAIHSAVGNSMIGAKVNNRIAGFDVPLHNGDIVEIFDLQVCQGPQPRLAEHLQVQSGAHQDQAVVQAGKARGEHHPRQGEL